METGIFLIDTGMLSIYYKGGRASALEVKDDEVTAIYESGEKVSFPSPVIDYGPPIVWKYEDGDPLAFDTIEDIEKFLLTSEISTSEIITTGVNRPLKVTLEKDGHKINAIFRHQSKSENLETGGPGPRSGKKRSMTFYLWLTWFQMSFTLFSNGPLILWRLVSVA